MSKKGHPHNTYTSWDSSRHTASVELGVPRLLPAPILEFQHLLVKLGIECCLLMLRIGNVDDAHDRPLAFARGTIKFCDLKKQTKDMTKIGVV